VTGSTYRNAEYQKAASAFADITPKSIQGADPVEPGLQPRPTVGVQYVAVPEFSDLATKISQDISTAIAGDGEVGPALLDGQKLAQQTGDRYQGL
jgi:sorbitol/mannitol transport system substrate-binding protein